jgi:outer membrane immunogenic protein
METAKKLRSKINKRLKKIAGFVLSIFQSTKHQQRYLMKKLLMKLSVVAVMLTTSIAAYADVPVPGPYYQGGYGGGGCCPNVCDPCCYNQGFEGFYIGGNIGAIQYTSHITNRDLIGGLAFPGTFSATDINVTAGGQIGYDWLCCDKLFGIVADFNWSNVETETRHFPNLDGTDYSFKSELNWYATIRARGGVVVGCDALVYITAGAVAAHVRHETDFTTTALTFSDTFHKTRWGWCAGFGTEWIVCGNWSFFGELLWLGFNQHVDSITTTVSEFEFDFSHSAWLARVGINYRFGCDWFCW